MSGTTFLWPPEGRAIFVFGPLDGCMKTLGRSHSDTAEFRTFEAPTPYGYFQPYKTVNYRKRVFQSLTARQDALWKVIIYAPEDKSDHEVMMRLVMNYFNLLGEEDEDPS